MYKRTQSTGITTTAKILLAITQCMALLLVGGQLKAQLIHDYPEIPIYIAGYVAHNQISIDGRAEEMAWTIAESTTSFVDITGDVNLKPRFLTNAKLLWNEEYLYVLAQMEEPHINGDITVRDAVIFHNNDIELFVKPNPWSMHYAEFEVNALGTLWDLLLLKPYRNGGPAVTSWDAKGTTLAIGINGTINQPEDKDKSWVMEMAIPMNSLKEIGSKRLPSSYWRLNFSRVQWRYIVNSKGQYEKLRDEKGKIIPEDNWVWAQQSAIDMHRPEHWGYLVFENQEIDLGQIRQHEIYEQCLFFVYKELRSKSIILDDLNDGVIVNGQSLYPKAEATPSGYTISLIGADGTSKYSIDQDGEFKIDKKN